VKQGSSVMIIYLLMLSLVAPQSPPPFKTYTVKKVINGNTFQIANGEIIQLVGIKAPENYPSDKAKLQSELTGQSLKKIIKMGKKSTKALKKLIKGKKIYLELDVQAKNENGKIFVYAFVDFKKKRKNYENYVYDKNGRLFINATMLKSGLAGVRNLPENFQYSNLFYSLFLEAVGKKKGLWSKKGWDSSRVEKFVSLQKMSKCSKKKIREITEGHIDVFEARRNHQLAAAANPKDPQLQPVLLK